MVEWRGYTGRGNVVATMRYWDDEVVGGEGGEAVAGDEVTRRRGDMAAVM